MQKVVYRGEIVELQGTSWEVPDSVPMTGRKAWIESQHREAELQAAANAERAQREQEVLAARLEKAKQDASIEKLTSDIESLSAGLEELGERIVSEPDVSAQLQFNAAAADIYARNLSLADEVRVMQDTVADLLERTAAMAEAAKTGEALQQQSLALLKNNQDAINGSFETYRRALADLQDQTNNASRSVGALNTAAQDNRELIKTASEITEAAVDVARQEAKAAVDEGMDDMLAVLSFTLQALGIDEAQLALQVNTDRIDPHRGIYLTRDFVSKLAEIHARMGANREASDRMEPRAWNVP